MTATNNTVEETVKVVKSERSVYKHGLAKEAGKIDTFLLTAKTQKTAAEIATALKLSTARIKSHIYHLKSMHNVTFAVNDETGALLINK